LRIHKINGGYYRAQVMKILTEALDQYDVDGLFFNMFGNQSRDYSGHEVGLCHCDACRTRTARCFTRIFPRGPTMTISKIHVRHIARSGERNWCVDSRKATGPRILHLRPGIYRRDYVGIGRLYYRLSLPARALFFRDVIDRMNPGRQPKTNAHLLVEMTLMKQAAQTLVHLIN
jgi:hypothetical protein